MTIMSAPHPLQIDTFLPYMRDVTRCEQSLRELSLMWRMIESSAKMNCPVEASTIIPTMAATRAGFDRLEHELVSSLVREKVMNVLAEIGTKSQYVIDIVVRNLYERTADVGFLATDRELCAFAAGIHDHQNDIRERLLAYRRKYTVYDEIMLLDTEGNVLMQIDDHMRVEGSLDPLIKETLESDSYVETFRATDLRPGKQRALIYSRKMMHPDNGKVIGILCLSFDFEQEMAGIFTSHRDAASRSNMLLLDHDNRVIATADPLWIPIGATVPVNHNAYPILMMFGGREYLVRTFYAEGYQGYMGPPGWQGQVMIPVDVAFAANSDDALDGLDANMVDGLLSHAKTFCPPLYEIMNAAETIRRVVWNGQVMAAGQRGDLLKLKTILDQIGETGNRSNELFSKSIRDLYETVLGSSLLNAQFTAHLLVDLLDRNLYERADDCRWWALTPELRTVLAEPEQNRQGIEKIASILSYINKLYTVYTRIFVYDRSGRIIASTDTNREPLTAFDSTIDQSSSELASNHVIGATIEADTLASILALATEQDYFVSPFVPTPLYDNRPTYVYHAAIRHPDNPATVVGGIGIVFDAAVEFLAMLRGGINEKEKTKAFFIDRSGHIISSTDSSRPVGSRLDIEPAMLALENGKSASSIVVHDNDYAIMGCSASSGYREFKVLDGYKEDVLAVVYESLGEVREYNTSRDKESYTLDGNSPSASSAREFATFFIDQELFALPAETVTEAFTGSAITPMSMGSRQECIGMLSLPQGVIWVFDLGHIIRGTPSVIDSSSQVLIVRHGEKTVGLLVSELHGVPEFSESEIMPTPLASLSEGMLVPRVIKANGGRLLIQAIDVANLFCMLQKPEAEMRELRDWTSQ